MRLEIPSLVQLGSIALLTGLFSAGQARGSDTPWGDLVEEASVDAAASHQALAEAGLRSALHLANALGADRNQSALIHRDLAAAIFRQGRVEEAEEFARTALSLKEKAVGPKSPGLSSYLCVLGKILSKPATLAEAEETLKRALALVEGASYKGPEGLEAASIHFAIGSIQAENSDFDEARDSLRRCLEIRRVRLPRGGLERGLAERALANVESKLGHDAEAARLARRAVRSLESAPDATPAMIAGTFAELGGYCHTLGRLTEAETAFKLSLSLLSAYPDPGGEKRPEVLVKLAKVQIDAGHFSQAEASLERSRDILGRSPEKADEGLVAVFQNLARVHVILGKTSDAERELRRAGELISGLEGATKR